MAGKKMKDKWRGIKNNDKQIILNCRTKKEADFMTKWCIKGFMKIREKQMKVCKHYQPYSMGYCNLTSTDRQCPKKMEECIWFKKKRKTK